MQKIANHPGWVYILRLEGGFWYVGHTKYLRSRFAGHFKHMQRTKWTELHKPVAVQAFFIAPIFMESVITMDMASNFGADNVRGAFPLFHVDMKKNTPDLCPFLPEILPAMFTHAGYTEPLRLSLGTYAQLLP